MEPLVVSVTRDGAVESLHRGSFAVCAPDGRVLAGLGDVHRPVYVRSSVKPVQALASADLVRAGGGSLDSRALAIACASHAGSDEQQIEAARILALAGLDESALRCPTAWPSELPALRSHDRPERLAHNCSGKHAAFCWAQASAGAQPSQYLDPGSAVQQRVRLRITELAGALPGGWGVDGCGAPAWRLPLHGLATAFARLAEGVAGDGRAAPDVVAVRDAMRAHPELVGSRDAVDFRIMAEVAGAVAKRGAEGVLAVGWTGSAQTAGIAVKIADGGARATGPVAATVLLAAGAEVSTELRRPPVLGGGEPHGAVAVTGSVRAALGGLHAGRRLTAR